MMEEQHSFSPSQENEGNYPSVDFKAYQSKFYFYDLIYNKTFYSKIRFIRISFRIKVKRSSCKEPTPIERV